MDASSLDTVSKVILTVGFPIVMCLLLWYQMLISDKNHKAEVDALKDVITDVKIAITELKDAISGGDMK